MLLEVENVAVRYGGAVLAHHRGAIVDGDLGGATPSVTPDGGPPSTKSLITRIDPSVDGFLRPVEKSYGSEVADDLGKDG